MSRSFQGLDTVVGSFLTEITTPFSSQVAKEKSVPWPGMMLGCPYPLVNIQKAIENGPVEIVDFPIKNGDFPWQNVSSPEGSMIGPTFRIFQMGFP